MSIDTVKSKAGMRIAHICDVFVHQCKYTTPEWIAYGAGTLQTLMTDVSTGNITLSGTQATKFDEVYVYARFGNSPEIIKATVVNDTELVVIQRGAFGSGSYEHSIGVSIQILHSGEVDGSCFGTVNHCSSVNNYNETKEIRFRFPSVGSDLPDGDKYYGGLVRNSVSFSPPKVDPGVSMGKRGQVNFMVSDSVDNDLYCPYPERRTTKGTLFTKLMARAPYFEGRRMEVYTCIYKDEIDLNTALKREYLIDDFQLADGMAQFKGIDPLILTEDKKSKAPIQSLGRVADVGGITDASTTITYDNDVAFAYGPAATQLYIRIESEVLQVTVASDYVLNIDFRAALGTERKNHDQGTTIQKVLSYEDVHFIDIIEDLLQNFANVPSRFIDDYSAVKAETPTLTFTRHLTKPTEVVKLIDELIYNADITMWFDAETSKIRIRRVSDVNLQPISLNEGDEIGRNSIISKRLSSKQYTRASAFWGQSDATKESGDEYYKVGYIAANVSNEQAYNKGEVSESKTVYNNWLTGSPQDFTKGSSAVQRTIDRTESMPYEYEFEIDIENTGVTQAGELDLGSVINVTTSRRVDGYGNPLSENYQIVSLREMNNLAYKINAILYQEPISGVDVDFVISENKEDYDLSTEFAPAAGSYTIFIETGVVIGATSTANPAFTTGSQAAGVSFHIINRGSILGAGGRGGDAGQAYTTNPQDQPLRVVVAGTNGFPGGDAFEATVACTIDTGSGVVWGGGGGAAGGLSIADSTGFGSAVLAGNGGSGGAGYVGGVGGLAGHAEIEPGFIQDDGIDGVNGTQSAPGSLAGVSGGDYGESGDDKLNIEVGNRYGGASGLSIKDNGNTVTITSGSQGGNLKPSYLG